MMWRARIGYNGVSRLYECISDSRLFFERLYWTSTWDRFKSIRFLRCNIDHVLRQDHTPRQVEGAN